MPGRPEKSPVRLVRFGDIRFGPRFEHGDMARIAEVCGENDGTELGVGWARLTGARIPWTIRYDEVLTVFERQLRLHAGGRLYSLEARDSIRLPAGTELVYGADYASIHFAIHTSSRASGPGAPEQ